MDRYTIISGKEKKRALKKKAPKKKQEKPTLPKNVKRVTQVWAMEDKERFISFEVSPKDCKCYNCRKKIPKQTPRYKVVERHGYWNVTEFYHQKRCLPKHLRDWVSKYPGRNFDREEMNERYRTIRSLIDSLGNEEYREKLVKKIVSNYLTGDYKGRDDNDIA